jgi:hypothetical protein
MATTIYPGGEWTLSIAVRNWSAASGVTHVGARDEQGTYPPKAIHQDGQTVQFGGEVKATAQVGKTLTVTLFLCDAQGNQAPGTSTVEHQLVVGDASSKG